ncbi:MAG: gliding motility-associated C-terminal domain-containing protein [Sphingobacteriales bacterium]|nr:gliding motility-associated C-terminal domain-containing protein [Sphingobacteriales bacterium]
MENRNSARLLGLLALMAFMALPGAIQAQVSTCTSNSSIANFGINRTIYANSPAGVDDWFFSAGSPGSGIGIIGTSAATARPPLQISAADFSTLLQSATSVNGRNISYSQGMAVSSLTVQSNMLLLDAVAARDNIASGSAVDSTVFTGGGDKNGDSPSTWSIGVGATQQKSDIVDVGGHLRRDLGSNDLWSMAYASVLSPGGDAFLDFEFFRSIPSISGGILANSGPTASGGHTPFLLSASGAIQSPGDVLVGVNSGTTSGQASVRIWINPSNVDGAGNNLAWYNGLPNRFFTFTGDVITGLNSNGYGYAEIVSLNSSSCLVYSAVNTAPTTAGPWGTLSGSGAPFASAFTTAQLVEIAINFSDFGLDLNSVSGACFNIFGSMIVKTRSSSSWSSELKDLSGPFTFGNFSEVQASAGSDQSINCSQSTVTLNGSSLTPGAVYNWSTSNGNILSGANTFNPVIDQPGTYVLTVSSPSLASCVTSDTVVVTRDTVRPTANAGSDWQYVCGSPNTFTLNGVGTTAGVDIQWTAFNGGSILSGANTLQPEVSATGCFVLTITNPLSTCFAADTVCGTSSNNPPVVTASLVSNPSCDSACNGTINLAVSGTAGPYDYIWSDGAVVRDRTGLCAGNYTVTVTAPNACSTTIGVQLAAPAPLTLASATGTVNVSCAGGSDGVVVVSASGGTAPYSGDGTFTGLNAGQYSYTVTDANGCSSTLSVTIDQPLPISLTTTSQLNVACFGDSSGQVEIAAAGGTAPYFGAGTVGGLSAGTYSYIVTDLNGCSESISVTISEPAALVASSSAQVNASCFGNNDGSVTISASGGVAPYSGEGTFTQLNAGSYTYVVSDANGCTREVSVSITEPQASLQIASTQTDILCFGDLTGIVDVSVSGGTQPFTYTWSNGSSQEDLSGVGAGQYDLVITDANGCTQGISATLIGPSATLSASAGVSQVLCNGGTDGSVSLATSGGTSPYSYAWSNGQTTADINGLPAGSYDVLVTDANGCTISQFYTINEPTALQVSVSSSSQVNCNGGADGSVSIVASGGTSPYSGDGTFSGLAAGTYSYTVTDANGCTSSVTAQITEPVVALGSSVLTTNVSCYGDASGSADVTVVGGTQPFGYSWSNGSSNEDLSGVPAGQYTLVITDANGCSVSLSASIQEPVAPLAASAILANVSCFGDASGGISLTASGGTAPYTYAWSNGQTTSDLTSVVAGSYSVLVTDANGCTYDDNFQITEPTGALNATAASAAVLCNGGNNGSIDLTVSGGTSPYSFAWSNAASTEDLSGLSAGSYSVIVTDVNGCTASSSVTVAQPVLAISLSASATGANCITGQLGTTSASANGGTSPYVFAWSNGSSSAGLSGLQPGTFTVTVTDANGCSSQQSLVVDDNSILDITTIGDTVICVGESVEISADPVPNATYQWLYNGSPLQGATTYTFTTLVGGIYQLQATTSCGTYTSNPIEVVLSTLSAVTVSSNVVICSDETTQLQASGGLLYTWSPGLSLSDSTISDPVAAPRVTTDYVVTVTDELGCTATGTVTVTIECDPIEVPNGFSPNNDGKNDTFVIDGIDRFPGNALYIYNRWGNLVYKEKDYANQWDGRSNVDGTILGQELPNGTYFYILDLNTGDKPLNGFVMIRR